MSKAEFYVEMKRGDVEKFFPNETDRKYVLLLIENAYMSGELQVEVKKK